MLLARFHFFRSFSICATFPLLFAFLSARFLFFTRARAVWHSLLPEGDAVVVALQLCVTLQEEGMPKRRMSMVPLAPCTFGKLPLTSPLSNLSLVIGVGWEYCLESRVQEAPWIGPV